MRRIAAELLVERQIDWGFDTVFGDGGFAMLMAESLTVAGYGLPMKAISTTPPLAHPGPALVDVVVNTDEQPMPAKAPTTRGRASPRPFCTGGVGDGRLRPPSSATGSASSSTGTRSAHPAPEEEI